MEVRSLAAIFPDERVFFGTGEEVGVRSDEGSESAGFGGGTEGGGKESARDEGDETLCHGLKET